MHSMAAHMALGMPHVVTCIQPNNVVTYCGSRRNGPSLSEDYLIGIESSYGVRVLQSISLELLKVFAM